MLSARDRRETEQRPVNHRCSWWTTNRWPAAVWHGFLSHEGFPVECAADGLEALDRLALRRFDHVVLDLQMPRMDGLEVLARLGGRSDRPRVVVCSGAGAEELETARRLGADAALAKPVPLDQLLTLLRAPRPADRSAGDRSAPERSSPDRSVSDRLLRSGSRLGLAALPGLPALPASVPERKP